MHIWWQKRHAWPFTKQTLQYAKHWASPTCQKLQMGLWRNVNGQMRQDGSVAFTVLSKAWKSLCRGLTLQSASGALLKCLYWSWHWQDSEVFYLALHNVWFMHSLWSHLWSAERLCAIYHMWSGALIREWRISDRHANGQNQNQLKVVTLKATEVFW